MGGGNGSEGVNSREPWTGSAEYPRHQGIMPLGARLNTLYRKNPAMHAQDNYWTGFEWVEAYGYAASVLPFCARPRTLTDLWSSTSPRGPG
jgi:1,4-alpha-glucan branching enzyme